jgi:hypothetical protein
VVGDGRNPDRRIPMAGTLTEVTDANFQAEVVESD